MKKTTTVLLTIFLLVSCVGDTSLSNKKISGSWYGCMSNQYEEYFFENDTLYIYRSFSGDITTYKYYIDGSALMKSYFDEYEVNEFIKHGIIFKYKENQSIKFGTQTVYMYESDFSIGKVVAGEIGWNDFVGEALNREQNSSCSN